MCWNITIVRTLISFNITYKSSSPELFLEKGVLKISSKFKEEHLCRSVISEFTEVPVISEVAVQIYWNGMGALLSIFCIFSENFFLNLLLHDNLMVYILIYILIYTFNTKKLRYILVYVFKVACRVSVAYCK